MGLQMGFHIFITALAAAAAISAVFASGVVELDQSVSAPRFGFSWLNDKKTFEAGDVATIKIKVVDAIAGNNASDPLNGRGLNLTLVVNGKTGNSTYVSGVSFAVNGDFANWSISFVPISVGVFNVDIIDEHFGISDASLRFEVLPGHMYPSASTVSWRDLVHEFVAGERAAILILPKDAFGNNISTASAEPNSYKFTVSLLYENGSIGSLPNLSYVGWTGFGYVGIEFIAAMAGNFLLRIEGQNQSLNGSPLPFQVKPGQLDISKCTAKSKYDTKALRIFSKLEVFIHQQDQFGNLVQGWNQFDADIVEKETNLSIPIADLNFIEIEPGIQLLSFSVTEPGEFLLTIFDLEKNRSVSNMPYEFIVFVGYCDGFNSVANGSGLASAVAGEISKFSIYLEDRYHNPSPVDAEVIRVQIVRKSDSSSVWPSIIPQQNDDGNVSRWEGLKGTTNLSENAPTPSVEPKYTASAFDVTYKPEKSGTYEILMSCGNIPLDGGPRIVDVLPGAVNTELSGVIKFVAKVSKLVKNEIVVQLVDSFSNPIVFQETKLRLEFRFANASDFLFWKVLGNNDGSYGIYYRAKEIGAYDACVSFEGKNLSPCPFHISVYNSDYFPKAFNDTISVWEDESISFDVLENDFFARGSGTANIVQIVMPQHGSILQYGRLFRYTPYKGFFGNDILSYTILDVNNNSAVGTVFVSVLITPPQLILVPDRLLATEEAMSPRFGGFVGIAIEYSDPLENISVTLRPGSGTIFLSPMLMQNEDFSGEDIIQVFMRNKNGIHYGQIPVFVQPINDPPFIHIPEFIILEGNKDGSQIFGEHTQFSIGDPDILSFPGDKSFFTIFLSMEVDDGILTTSLPSDLLNTTELKLKNSNQWQPLQTFVTISKHFLVKGKGVRFRGTVKECNEALQNLLYQGGEYGAVLTVTINDMGNYGCYPDCEEGMSLPLFVEATINLIRRRPMSSLSARGSLVMMEFIMMIFLGGLLLFFVCKCAIDLRNERRGDNNKQVLKDEKSWGPTSSRTSSGNATYFTGCFSNPFFFGSQRSTIRQRSFHQSGNVDAKSEGYSSQTSTGNCQRTPVSSFMPLATEKNQKEDVLTA
ncbi:hypothetical protein Scep_008997 [Stephania cephalantha]|uniref:GEX2 N-terminal Ig-like domain-containing protein n=1 Tax=Stephania cephalantha TaxID=152367 RepID=A0AAP0PFW1_9MAGN